MTRAAHYARFEDVDRFARAGWMPTDALYGTVPHGEYAVLMVWLCECEPAKPHQRASLGRETVLPVSPA